MRYAVGGESGRIEFFREADDEYLEYYRSQGEVLIPAPDPSIDQKNGYICDGEVKARPSMPISVSGARITGIPAGSVLTLGEQEYQVDDGEAEITGYSGTVKITCWPYLDAEVVV